MPAYAGDGVPSAGTAAIAERNWRLFMREAYRRDVRRESHQTPFAVLFVPRDRLHSGGGSCPRTAPPGARPKNTVTGDGLRARWGAPSAVTHRLRSGSVIGHDRTADRDGN